MTIVSVEHEEKSGGKTPTLRQWLKDGNGKHPKQSNVRVIFKPGKYDQYGLVADHGFRVSVPNTSKLYSWLEENLEPAMGNNDTLVICITDAEKAYWTLGTDTDQSSDWEEADWGYKSSIQPPKKRETKKTAKVNGNTGLLTD